VAFRKTILAAGVLTLVSGCARYDWEKAGVTPTDFAQDKQECDRQARLMADEYELAFPGPASWHYPYLYDTTRTIPNDRLVEEQRVYTTCMRAKGYTLVKQPR
jgi:hypothetical protein